MTEGFKRGGASFGSAGLEPDIATGCVQVDRRVAAADGTPQMLAVGDLGRTEGEVRRYPAAAGFGVDRCTRVLGQHDGDIAAGGTQVDATIGPQLGSYIASRGVGFDPAIVVLEANAAARGAQVEIPRRIRDIYAATGSAQF